MILIFIRFVPIMYLSSYKNLNNAPVADAGINQEVEERVTVILNGAGSSDPDDDELFYRWTAPEGIELSSSTAISTEFVAPNVTSDTTLIFTLIVNDGTVDSEPVQVLITIKNLNNAPVADAGINQEVEEGVTVILNGAGSSDPDDDELFYRWTAPEGIELSSSTAISAEFVAPNVTSDTTLIFTLIVNDGTVDSEPVQVLITIKNLNNAPVADAGINQEVEEGVTVILNGAGSSDPDDDELFYRWTAPEGIELSSSTAISTEFVAPNVTSDTTLIFTLIVNDGTVDSEPVQVLITIKNLNNAPVADAGINQEVEEGVTVILDASGSKDPDGDKLRYHWTCPEGIELSSSTAISAEFVAPNVTSDTTLIFTLIVNDGTVDSEPVQVLITIKNLNNAPVADAGINQEVEERVTVILNGAGSSDPDDDELFYRWTAPEGIELSSSTAISTEFVAPNVTSDTTLIFTLIVNDGTVDSEPVQVLITIKNLNNAPVADAGINQEVEEGVTVILNGAGSSDPDDDELFYRWTAPEGIELSSSTAISAEFVAPNVTSDTTLIFTLIVNDGTVDSEPVQVLITIKNLNNAPVADAGINQEVEEGVTVILNGAGSSDPDDDELFYRWTAPEGIELSSSTAISAEFVAPNVTSDTTLIFTLIVNDGTVDSEPVQVLITIKNLNNAPVADAGINQEVEEGVTVILNGAGSSDPDDDELFYRWTAPEGIELSSVNIASPEFVTPEVKNDTVFTFMLIVNDGIISSSPSFIYVKVTDVITHIELPDSNSELKIYPNPTSGLINLEVDKIRGSNMEITISNLLGQGVFQTYLYNTGIHSIDLSDQMSGLYLIRISESDQTLVKKLIINQ